MPIFVLQINNKELMCTNMKIIVNGKEQDIDQTTSDILSILKQNHVKNPDLVSVQLNGNFVDKSKYASTQLRANDELDFLYFMGGG